MKTGKLVSIVLTLAMLLSVLPMSAMAYGGENEDQTAEIKVLFGEDGASGTITLTTKTDNSATLKVAGLADSYNGMTLTAKRWNADDEDGDPTLEYISKYDDVSGTLPLTTINKIFKFNTSGAPTSGEDNTASISVTVKDGVRSYSAPYTLTGNTGASENTLSATTTDQTNSQSAWELFSADSHFSITDYETAQDSYVILPVGSMVQAAGESLTVNKKLKLDDLGDVDGLASAYKDSVICDEVLVTTEYDPAVKILLKAGAQLIAGTREVQLLKDLTIELAGITFDPYTMSLSNIDSAITDNNPSGEWIATCFLNDFVYPILGKIEGKTAEDDVTLTFTFADAKTSSAAELTGTTEGTTITTNAVVKLGGTTTTTTGSDTDTTDNTYTSYEVPANAEVTVGATTTVTDSSTNTTTKVDEYVVTNTSSETTYVYEITETKTTTTGTETTKTETKTAITTTVDTYTVKKPANENASDTPSDYVNVAEVLTAAVADTTNSISDVKSITSMQIALVTNNDVSTDDVNAAKAKVTNQPAYSSVDLDGAITTEVHPVAYVYTSDNETPDATYPIETEQLADKASFQYTITGLTSGTTYNVYHVHSDNTVTDLGSQPASDGSITVTLNSFSYLLSVPVTSTSSNTAEIVSMNAYYGEFFILNLYVKTDAANPTFSFTRSYDNYPLNQSTTKTEFLEDIKSTYYVQDITSSKPTYNDLGIENTYKKAFDPGYNYYMVSVKLYTQYLDQTVTVSMKDGDGNSIMIQDYYEPTYNLGTDQTATELSHSFVGYLDMMNTYYTGISNSTKAGYYSSLSSGLSSAAQAVRSINS